MAAIKREQAFQDARVGVAADAMVLTSGGHNPYRGVPITSDVCEIDIAQATDASGVLTKADQLQYDVRIGWVTWSLDAHPATAVHLIVEQKDGLGSAKQMMDRAILVGGPGQLAIGVTFKRGTAGCRIYLFDPADAGIAMELNIHGVSTY